MFCEKCGSDIGNNEKCPICGHVNTPVSDPLSGEYSNPPIHGINSVITKAFLGGLIIVGIVIFLFAFNGDGSGTPTSKPDEVNPNDLDASIAISSEGVSNDSDGEEPDEPIDLDDDYIINQEAAHNLKTIEANIPQKAVTFQGHSYYIYDDGCESWDEAKKCCESRGGYLAVINSSEENEFLFDYMLEDNKDEVFFGYTDQEQEGTWKWVAGNESTFTDWGINNAGEQEPNADSVYENYAHMNSTMHDGYWNDKRFGKTTTYYFCEWNLINYQGKDCKGTTTQDKVPMRNNVKNGADVIVYLKQNEEVRVLFQLTREDGETVYYVQHKSGEIGYIDAKLMEIKN